MDANLLLHKLKDCHVLQTLQDGHQNLDMAVQHGVQNILTSLTSKFGLKVIVVIDGLRPKCVSTESGSLTKSKQIWDAFARSSKESAEASDTTKNEIYRQILEEYSSRFY